MSFWDRHTGRGLAGLRCDLVLHPSVPTGQPGPRPDTTADPGRAMEGAESVLGD